MTPHTQFFIAALAALVVTSPGIMATPRREARFRQTIIALFVSGYALIGATFIIDDLVNPPLFFHGFVPGIGIGLILASLSLAIMLRYNRGHL